MLFVTWLVNLFFQIWNWNISTNEISIWCFAWMISKEVVISSELIQTSVFDLLYTYKWSSNDDQEQISVLLSCILGERQTSCILFFSDRYTPKCVYWTWDLLSHSPCICHNLLYQPSIRSPSYSSSIFLHHLTKCSLLRSWGKQRSYHCKEQLW